MIAKCVWCCLALVFALTAGLSAQNRNDSTLHEDGDTTTLKVYEKSEVPVFTFVERMPEFPGGERAMQDFLLQNITYPDSARAKGIEGRVYVRFVVDREGLIQKPEV